MNSLLSNAQHRLNLITTYTQDYLPRIDSWICDRLGSIPEQVQLIPSLPEPFSKDPFFVTMTFQRRSELTLILPYAPLYTGEDYGTALRFCHETDSTRQSGFEPSLNPDSDLYFSFWTRLMQPRLDAWLSRVFSYLAVHSSEHNPSILDLHSVDLALSQESVASVLNRIHDFYLPVSKPTFSYSRSPQ